MIILHIESSTRYCSVALSEDDQSVFFKSNDEGMNHAALLSLFIRDAFNFLNERGQKVDAVAVSSGPGSYTGLRIGVATAKGLCYGSDLPLISVSTLETIAVAGLNEMPDIDPHALLVPMIDARRMEVYSAVYDTSVHQVREVLPEIITSESYADLLQNHKIYFMGDGAAKCKETIQASTAHFIDNIHPLAINMIPSAVMKYRLNKFEDLAYFEPFYLKEFQGTVPKNPLKNL